MIIRMLVAAALLSALGGCAGRLSPGGYVSSNLPGVAEVMMDWKMDKANHTCPKGTTEHQIEGGAERYSTVLTPQLVWLNALLGTDFDTSGEAREYQQHCQK